MNTKLVSLFITLLLLSATHKLKTTRNQKRDLVTKYYFIMHTHTRVHSHTHARTHAGTHTHTRARKHVRVTLIHIAACFQVTLIHSTHPFLYVFE
jgi:hypothetical protein